MSAPDTRGLARRAETAGRAAAQDRLDRIAAAIDTAYPALDIEREIGRLRVSGAGLRQAIARDARLRLPELWPDTWPETMGERG